MKLPILISAIFLSNTVIWAQVDSSAKLKSGIINDSNKTILTTPRTTPNKNMVVQKKDLKLIMPIEGINFIVDGDTLLFSQEEIESGLSIEELRTIRANKDELLAAIRPPKNDEEEKYPFLFHLRNYLGVAKSVGVIIILILSLLK